MSDLDKLAPDFVALQADLVPVEKSAANPFFKSKYAPLPEVREAMQPLLAKHNFGLATLPTIIRDDDGRIHNGLHFILLHASGQKLEGEWMLTPAKNDSQGQGADVTYKRRFGEMAITGLVADEDDDGNTAARVSVAAPPRKSAPVSQPPARKPAAPAKPSDADTKRNELRAMAASKGWDTAVVADSFTKYMLVTAEKPVDIRAAAAEDLDAFMVALNKGAVTIE